MWNEFICALIMIFLLRWPRRDYFVSDLISWFSARTGFPIFIRDRWSLAVDVFFWTIIFYIF